MPQFIGSRLLRPGIPLAVLVGLASNMLLRDVVGSVIADYAGFALTVAVVTWFVAEPERDRPGFSIALCAAAGLCSVAVLYAIRQIPM
ncbi:MAG TPA: hypothetical protein VK912_06545 [Longimicrobiales bacterium]|nr:hypothetical protein [Longimicrobiales bacterium]